MRWSNSHSLSEVINENILSPIDHFESVPDQVNQQTQRTPERLGYSRGFVNRSFAQMRNGRSALLVALATCAMHGSWVNADAPTSDSKALSLLERYCYDCHGEGASKGGLKLDRYPNERERLSDHKTWDKVRQYLEAYVMPPEGKASPSRDERTIIARWIDERVFYVDPERPDPGHVTLRRLNRTEYNNTVRDLLFVDSKPGNHFPPDDSGYGFDNIGEVLSLSPAHMEKLLQAADRVVDEAVWIKAATVVKISKNKEELVTLSGTIARREGVPVLDSPEKKVGVHLLVPATSKYKISVKAAAILGENAPATLRLMMDGKTLKELKIDSEWKNRESGYANYGGHFTIPFGKRTFSLQPAPDETKTIAVEQLHFKGPTALSEPQASPFLNLLLGNDIPGPPSLNMSGEDLTHGAGKWGLDTGKSYLRSNGYLHTSLHVEEEGKYRIKIKAGAQQLGEEFVRFQLRRAGQTLAGFAIKSKNQEPNWFQTVIPLPAGEQKLEIRLTNYLQDDDTKAERRLWLHELEIEGPLGQKTELEAKRLSEIILKTGERLYRRPLDSKETKRLEDLSRKSTDAGEPPLNVFRLAMTGMLISPKFLFHKARPSVAPALNGSVLIDDFSLASRLSYFIWSSAPDPELLELAVEGRLRDNLDAQVHRMLKDPKARAFTEGFAGQWLQLRDMNLIAPDPSHFPAFDPNLRKDMKRETELLFAHVLETNRSVVEFLNADYSFLNPRLARHYGIEAGHVQGFKKVPLANSKRKGLLSHGSLLALTSYPTRTSPVRRGKFVLEQILGTPPPPPPSDVPSLEEADEKLHPLPVRKQLELHRKKKVCASCHAFLDPIGLALENFDALGRYRVMDGDLPIDASGKLVTGQAFRNFLDLTTILVKDKQEEFVRHLTKSLLTYALGRGINYKDKLAIRNVMTESATNGYRFRDLILNVCQSVPFQRMRTEEATFEAKPNDH